MFNTNRPHVRTNGDDIEVLVVKSVGVLRFVATCGCGVVLDSGQVMCGRCATR